MITFGAPGFLVAGLLAALVPLALHLIRRRPPSRSPLPTARFLAEDARSAVRVSRPTDLLLLALRMLLLTLAGAALARPAWVPAPEGTRELVLLDRGAAAGPDGWRAAVGEARRRLLDPADAARGELVLFDTVAVTIPAARLGAAAFDSLAAAAPSPARASYAAALRAIPAAARALRGADSIRVTLVSPLDAAGWDEGLAPLRRAAWPGAIHLVRGAGAAPSPPDDAAVDSGDGRRAVVIAEAAAARFVPVALEATGWSVRRVDPTYTIPNDASVYFVLAAPSAPLATALADRVGAGATVVTAGAAALAVAGSPWRPGQDSISAGGEARFGDGLSLADAGGRFAGEPNADAGAVTLATWDDGRIAAVAADRGDGCLVHFAAELEGGSLPLSPAFPRALDRLARGCESTETPIVGSSLDAGARAVLRGGGPAVVAAGSAAASGGGVRLGRWLMAAALAVALAETWLAYFRRTGA